MADLSKDDLRALDRDEKELVEKTGAGIDKLSDQELSDLLPLLRRARNRARNIGDRQGREARGKAAPKGASPAGGNEGTVAKAEVIGAALSRLQDEQKRRRKDAARAERKAAKEAEKAAQKAEKQAQKKAEKQAEKQAERKAAKADKPAKEKPGKDKPAKPAKDAEKTQKQLARKAARLKAQAEAPDHPTDKTPGKGMRKNAHKDQAPSGALDHAGEKPSRERSRHRQTRAEQK